MTLDGETAVHEVNERFFGMLGMSRRAGKTVVGADLVCRAMQGKNKPALVVVSSFASENTKKRMIAKCDYYGVPCVLVALECWELAQRLGKHRCGSAKGISCLGIDYSYIAVFDGAYELSDKSCIVGELSLTDAADVTKELFSSDESVDGYNVICSPRVDCLCSDFEVHKGVMITQKHEGRF